MQSITIAEDTTVTIPIYGSRAFKSGDIVFEDSPYFFPILYGDSNLRVDPISRPVTGISATAISGMVLAGHRIVYQVGKQVYLASCMNNSAKEQLHITTQAAIINAEVELHTYGPITDPSWNWSLGPIWLSSQGQLTQTYPTDSSCILVTLGIATDVDTIFFDPKPAVQLV